MTHHATITSFRRCAIIVAMLCGGGAAAAPVHAGGGISGGGGGSELAISELRVNQVGPNNDEYIELSGSPGASLAGVSYIVIGDGGGISGVIEAVVDLGGLIVPPSGRLLIVESTFTLPPGAAAADVVLPVGGLNFENDDNVTHLLVLGFSGAIDQDLDPNNDGVLDLQPWALVFDKIALVKSSATPPMGTEWHYGPPSVGPDGSTSPSHVYRCASEGIWKVGTSEIGANDTPGGENLACPPPPVWWHFGLGHIALGGGVFSTDTTGALVVTGLGASDQDGVSIETGPCVGWTGAIDFGKAGSLAAGASTKLKAHFQTGDVPSQAELVIDGAGDGSAAISFSQNTCPACSLTVQASLAGVTVASMNYPPPYPAALVTGDLGSASSQAVEFEWRLASPPGATAALHARLPEATQVTVSGSPSGPVTADQVRLLFNPGAPGAGLVISKVQLTASDVPQVRLRSEHLAAHELTHVAQGNGRLQGAASEGNDGPPYLVVSNIGSSGSDGVEITDCCDDDGDGAADLLQRLDVDLALATGTLNNGNSFRMHVDGPLVDDGLEAFQTFVQVQRAGSVCEVTTDVGSLGSSTYTVEIYAGGTLVATYPGRTGSLAATTTADGLLAHAAAEVLGDVGGGDIGETIQLRLRWIAPPGGMTFTLSGQPPLPPPPPEVLGDEIRITAETPRLIVGGIGSARLGGINVGSFTILDEFTGKEILTCPADLDGSGSVNVDDLLAIINAWGPGPGSPADLNDDGVVNVDDLLAVINAWGPCG